MDQETMNQLLANKDKYKASNKSRETFEKEWLSYVNENGVDETAIKYLFTGFEYRRFHPFTNYMKGREDKAELVKMFFGSKEFYDNKPKSFRMALNLLGILFAEFPEEFELMAFTIRRLPDISYGKDKKRYPDIGKIFGKFFIAELNSETKLPSKEALMLRPAMMGMFIGLMNDGLDAFCALEGVKAGEKVVADHLREWLKSCAEGELEKPSEKVAENTEKAPTEAAEKAEKEAEKEPSETGGAETGAPKTSVFSWKYSIKGLVSYIEGLENTIKQMQIKIDLTEEAKERGLREIEALKAQLTAKNADIAALNEKNSELNYTVSMKGKEIDRLHEVVASKEAEIADRIKLADILSKDKSKQSDAVLQRLSSELASYYEDFMGAQEMEITAELGEVLRDQLSDVYQILKKNGISL